MQSSWCIVDERLLLSIFLNVYINILFIWRLLWCRYCYFVVLVYIKILYSISKWQDIIFTFLYQRMLCHGIQMFYVLFIVQGTVLSVNFQFCYPGLGKRTWRGSIVPINLSIFDHYVLNFSQDMSYMVDSESNGTACSKVGMYIVFTYRMINLYHICPWIFVNINWWFSKYFTCE